MYKAKENYSTGKHRTVTADEVAQLSLKTIPKSAKRFSCIECGEYVTFVRGVKVRPYFKHSKSTELTEYCTLRSSTFRNATIYEKAGLPLYLKKVNTETFELYLGFYSLNYSQMELAMKENLIVTILPFDENVRFSIPHIINTDKFPLGETTFIKIDFASKWYKIKYSSSTSAESLVHRWGTDAEGILEGGALFTCGLGGGRKIRTNSEVTTDTDYLYVSHSYMNIEKYEGMKCDKRGELVLKSDNSSVSYNVNKICFSPSNEQQFKELEEFCREKLGLKLVYKPDSLMPIWPPAIHRDNEVYFLEGGVEALFLLETEEKNAKVFLHSGGDIKEKEGIKLSRSKYILTFPVPDERTAVTINENYNPVYSILGHYKGPIRFVTNQITVIDAFDNKMDLGVHHLIPHKRKIRVLAPMKCNVVRFDKYHTLRSNERLTDERGVFVKDIEYGDQIAVLIGSALTPLISFQKPIRHKKTSVNLDGVYTQLRKMNSPSMPPPIWLKRLLGLINRDSPLYKDLKRYWYMNDMPMSALSLLARLYDDLREG